MTESQSSPLSTQKLPTTKEMTPEEEEVESNNASELPPVTPSIISIFNSNIRPSDVSIRGDTDILKVVTFRGLFDKLTHFFWCFFCLLVLEVVFQS